MKQPAPAAHDENLLAVAERHADSWRVLLVRRGTRPAILEAREFGAAEPAALSGWLDSKRCADLRVILPASSTIVRLVTMTVASPQQMLAAMRLQAEGMFLGSIPSVRLGLAVLDAGRAGEETERQGAIIAWPDGQTGVEVPTRLEPLTRYVPEAAAMLVLASGDSPAVSADRRDGSIAIAMRSTSGALLVRATREAPGSDTVGYDAWNEGLRRAIAETALNAGHAPADVGRIVSTAEASLERHGDTIVALDPGIAAVLRAQIDAEPSASADESWWRNWAVPIAASIVATSRLSDLAALRRIEEHEAPNTLERMMVRYSDPGRALLVAGAAILVIGLAPVMASWARVKVLEAKLPAKAGAFEKQQREVEQRIALYGEVAKRSVPMSKLLGDLACCTPDGIEVEVIQLSATQGLTLRGTARPQGETNAEELVSTMASLMDSSGVFSNTIWRFGVPDGRGLFKFDLESKVKMDVASAGARIEADRDWSVKTLAEFKYGKRDGKSTADAASSGSASSTQGRGTEVASAAAPADAGSSPAAASAPADAGDPAARPQASRPRPSGASSASTPSSGRGIGRRDAQPGSSEDEAGGPVSGESGAPAASGDGSMPSGPVRAASGAGSGGGPDAAANKNLVIPDPISDDELKSMTKEQLRGRLGELAKARNRQDIEPDLKTRLDADFKRVLDQLKALTQ